MLLLRVHKFSIFVSVYLMGIISNDFVLNWEHCVKSYMASVNINMMTCVPYVKRIERAVNVSLISLPKSVRD